MANCLKNGIRYEHIVQHQLQKNSKIMVHAETGGATSKPDISFEFQGGQINIECKTKKSFEGGGKRLTKDLEIPEECIHKILLGSYKPFNGISPRFLNGDRTLETWNKEKHLFKDEKFPIPMDSMAEYYRNKGVHYIQIEKKGLYHTGDDILNLGAPFFQCDMYLRIRCKRHTSSPMPGSVQSSIVFRTSSCAKSPVDVSDI